jgi:hypothetical protein
VDVGFGDSPEARQQDRHRGHHEQDVQSDDAVDQDGGQGLGAMLRVFVAEHHGFDEVAADRQTFSSVMRNFLIDS